jgi:hypothetical protein
MGVNQSAFMLTRSTALLLAAILSMSIMVLLLPLFFGEWGFTSF